MATFSSTRVQKKMKPTQSKRQQLNPHCNQQFAGLIPKFKVLNNPKYPCISAL